MQKLSKKTEGFTDSVIRRMALAEKQSCFTRLVGVAAVPGSSFFREPVNHLIRFHFAKQDSTLYAALNRLESIREKMPYRR